MIISRTPLRISFCGGGSDLPAFYVKHGGCVLSTSINKYIYLSVHPSFRREQTILKYSQTEIVNNLKDIQHVYFKAILKKLGVSGVEITSTADIPAGTGLGSSSSFSVGVLHSLYSYMGKFVSRERLAAEASDVEINLLRQPIGKQDQYAAAYGGLNFYEFNRDGSVFVNPVLMSQSAMECMQANLMLFYTGIVHSASTILKEQGENISLKDKEDNQKRMCDLAVQLRGGLQKGHVGLLGEILHEGWNLKRSLASGITTPEIDELYELALKNGATGGKLLGAGGGGFMLFYVPEHLQDKVRRNMPIPCQSFSFDRQGSALIYVGDKPD